MVPKREGTWRLVLNLKAQNAYTECKHFKMEDILSVRNFLSRDDYICKLQFVLAHLQAKGTEVGCLSEQSPNETERSRVGISAGKNTPGGPGPCGEYRASGFTDH